jgi:hypothetical protein
MTQETTTASATSRKKMKEPMKEEKTNQHETDAHGRKTKRRTKGLTEDQLNARPSQLLSLHADCRNCRRKLIFIGMQTINELSAQGRSRLDISRHQVLPKTLWKALEFRVTDIHQSTTSTFCFREISFRKHE